MDGREKHRTHQSTQDHPFSMSMGDLMAALLLIFVLLLAATLFLLQTELKSQVDVANKYKEVQWSLYEKLMETFEDSLDSWKADIDSTLTVKFKEPDVLFRTGASMLQPRFKQILNYFFPEYIKVLYSDDYKDHIEEIRIEGHTSSEWHRQIDSVLAYFKNMELSQNRTREVLKYCINTIGVAKNVSWITERLTANGLSSSRLIFKTDSNGREIENKEASRRVEFRIKTDAEEQILKMIEFGRDAALE